MYERKRQESMKIMEETDAKRQKIAGLLEYIEQRLSELEAEKQELQEYNKNDKERRCLEYALHQRELDEVTARLEAVEEERLNDIHNSNTKRKEFNQREVVVQVCCQSSMKSRRYTDHSGIRRDFGCRQAGFVDHLSISSTI